MTTPLGFAFPFRIDPASGGVARSSGSRKLRDNVLFLLQVELGERVLRRDYGGGLRALLHEPMGTAFFALIRAQLVKAIAEHEPRVELVELAVGPGLEPGEVEVDIVYVERATQTPERLGVKLDAFGGTTELGGLP